MFTIKEIEKYASKVEDEILNFNRAVNNIIKSLESIDCYIKYEDCSTLRKSVLLHIDSYNELSENISKSFMDLAYIMHRYSSESQKNIELTEADIQELTKKLDSINSLLNSTSLDIEVFEFDLGNDLF